MWCLTGLGRAYADLAQRANAERIVEQLLRDSRERSDLAIEIALINAELEEKEQALAWLEKAYQLRDGGMILLNVHPAFRRLHHDPRFADLARRVGLPPLLSETLRPASSDYTSNFHSGCEIHIEACKNSL